MLAAWFLLMAAIGIEVAATVSLPRTSGFRDPFWTTLVLLGYLLSIWMLAVVIKNIPVSIAYAVWSGLGTAGIVMSGMIFFNENIDPIKISMVLMIITGVVILNLHSAH
jgi:small multidrug resistance pump